MAKVKVGKKNTIWIPACQVQSGNVLVGHAGNTAKVTGVLDLDEQIVIYTDDFAVNVKRDLLTRIQKAA